MSDFYAIIEDKRPTLVDFFATWCGPCSMQSPIIDEVKQRMGDTVRILKIDIDKNDTLAAQYNVRSVPTLMIFKNGAIQWRVSGVQTANELEEQLRKQL